MYKIEVIAQRPQGFDVNDVVAQMLGTQHERSLLEFHRAHEPAPGVVVVEFDLDGGVGWEEVRDVEARLWQTPLVTVETVTARPVAA
jgi:hypothetical protein